MKAAVLLSSVATVESTSPAFDPPCSCALRTPGPGGQVLDGEPDLKERKLKRLRRIEGQVRGLQRMIEEDRYCADIMTQISSAHEALRAVGRELMRKHVKHCAAAATASPRGEAEPIYDELIEMMYRLSR